MNYVIGLKHTHSDFFYESRVLQDFPMIGYYDRDGSWFLIQNEFQANRIFEYPYVSYDNPRSENWSGFIKDTVTLSTELGELDETLVIHEGLYNMQEVYRTQNIGISAFLYFDDYWELIDYQIKNN